MSFGKKCSFFDCEPCITGRSAQSLAAARFAAEIKLQIAELWTAAGKNGRRDRLAGWQVGRLAGWQVGRLAGWQVGRLAVAAIGQLRVGSSVLTGLQAGSYICRTVSRRNARIDRLTAKPFSLYL